MLVFKFLLEKHLFFYMCIVSSFYLRAFEAATVINSHFSSFLFVYLLAFVLSMLIPRMQCYEIFCSCLCTASHIKILFPTSLYLKNHTVKYS